MDSSTTDVCEWCNRPMLPAGATVSAAAAKEVKRNGRPIVAAPQPSPEAEAGLPLHQEEPQEEAVLAQAQPAAQAAEPDVLLRPLGGGQHTDDASPAPLPQSSQAPQRAGSHGLSDEAMKTSIDISQYMGADQSIFRPVQKEAGYSSASSLDRVATKKTASAQTGPGSNWSENDRMIRCAIAGLVICLVYSLALFFVTKQVPDRLFTAIPLGSSGSFVTAIKFGIASGLVFGFMLGALLVKWQKGSGIGMLLGLILGYTAVGSFTLLAAAGAIAGIFAGRFATLGVRRVINV
ncbi:MAG: hypothetical protein ACE149_14610 [Armatimonadota bacterium]